MTAIIKEIFLDTPPYFRTFITYNEDNNNSLEVRDVFPCGDKWVSLRVHQKPLLLECERCHNEIQILDETDFGDLIDWNTPWEQFLCEDCHAQIREEVLDGACGVCNTEPCKRGRECWANPWPSILYLCYVAPRKQKAI